MRYKFLWAILAVTMMSGCSPVLAEPDYTKLCSAIHRIENGTFKIGTGKGEQYGIHSLHYKDALQARLICERTARHAWDRYLSGNQGKCTKNGYIQALSLRYCPVNHINWARMVLFYYKGGI